MAARIPNGYRMTGKHCGIKKASDQEDITLIVSDRDAVAAGVYTQNQFRAAPVVLDCERTPGSNIRAIVANSGNANACTGEQGAKDAVEMTLQVAKSIDVDPKQVLVLSTGIIGEHLPMDEISRGIADSSNDLGNDNEALQKASRGILTTDTHSKIAFEDVNCDDGSYSVLGIAKGAAMIGPNMATMLGVILTDAMLDPSDAQTVLKSAVDSSFNSISVEGHTSTNDTVLLLANGAAQSKRLEGKSLEDFQNALQNVCIELARAIPGDGEGATHRIEIQIKSARNRSEAHQIAKAVADGPLVKTAVHGADPNWGRIISAVGYAGVPIQPEKLRLHLNGTLLFENETPVPFDTEAVSNSIRENRETLIEIELQLGNCDLTFWTCDLTAEYVRLNADYHT